MAARKSKEQEILEAKLRTIRAYERRLEDIEWKHRVFLPALDKFAKAQAKLNPKPPLELEAGE